ncbi:UNVERIFIED_CONTAM: hypothetical protein K2H54_040056 [Gekko kuhli]
MSSDSSESSYQHGVELASTSSEDEKPLSSSVKTEASEEANQSVEQPLPRSFWHGRSSKPPIAIVSRKKRCFKCGSLEHLARFCHKREPSRQKSSTHQTTEQRPQASLSNYVPKHRLTLVTIGKGLENVRYLIDSGASKTFVRDRHLLSSESAAEVIFPVAGAEQCAQGRAETNQKQLSPSRSLSEADKTEQQLESSQQPQLRV